MNEHEEHTCDWFARFTCRICGRRRDDVRFVTATLALAAVGAAQVGWWVGENAPRTPLDELTRCYQDLSPRPEAMAHRLLSMGPGVTERALAACRRVIE